MTAALKPSVPDRRLSSRSSAAKQGQLHGNVSPLTRPRAPRREQWQQTPARLTSLRATKPSPVVRKLPQAKPLPGWLKLLIAAQRSSSVLTLCLVGSVLAVYGWTVYSQQLWSTNYQRLETLQRNERQLTAANEVLKNQIAQQAESPNSGLVIPRPDQTIFLQPAPLRDPVAAPASPAPDLQPVRPLGY